MDVVSVDVNDLKDIFRIIGPDKVIYIGDHSAEIEITSEQIFKLMERF